MSARAQQDRVVVALAAVACGRLSGAATVHAARGQCLASADQYRVSVIEPGSLPFPPGRRRRRRTRAIPEVVLEHWGGDAELLALRSPLTGGVSPTGPRQRAQVAARMLRTYDLDSLRIGYPDGAELSAGRAGVTLRGPRDGILRRRVLLVRATVDELAG